MKTLRYVWSVWMTLSLIFLTGCQADPEEIPSEPAVTGRVFVRPQGAWENESASNGAPETKTVDQEKLTYTFEAWTRGPEAKCVFQQTASGSMQEGVQLEISLIPGTYDFLFWADYGTGHYLTTNLKQVQVVTTPYQPGSRNDAFSCALEQVTWDGTTTCQAVLKRPVARVKFLNAENFSQAKTVSVVYGGLYTSYNVLTGEVSDLRTSLTVSYPETTVGSSLIGEDFLFVPAEGSSLSFSIAVGNVTKVVDRVPLRANYSTNISSLF